MMASSTTAPMVESSLTLTSLWEDFEADEGGGSDGETPVELEKPLIGTDDGLEATGWLEYLGAKRVPQKCLIWTIARELDWHRQMRTRVGGPA